MKNFFRFNFTKDTAVAFAAGAAMLALSLLLDIVFAAGLLAMFLAAVLLFGIIPAIIWIFVIRRARRAV